MSKEFKHYHLRSTRKPAKSPVVSTTVAVHNEEGHNGYCYISFSDSFVCAIGKKLPRGVAEYDPAYIAVRFNKQFKSWEIWARYLGDGSGVLLWATEEKPSWLNFYKREVENDCPSANPNPHYLRGGASEARPPQAASTKERRA